MNSLKYITISLIALIVFSCGKSKKQGNMTINGTITGLKKGTVYLQKVKDSSFISIDSVELKNTNTFTLTSNIESPEIFYISLGKNNSEKISFFGEKGIITLQSRLDKMVLSSKISGSKNNAFLEEYNKMVSKFNNKRLDLLKNKFEAYKSENLDSVQKLENLELNLLKRRYLYTANFAISKSDYEVAPYVALLAIDNANIKLLDTINKSLSDKVKNSVYGKKLDELLKKLQKDAK